MRILKRNLPAMIVGVLLVACVVAALATREPAAARPEPKHPGPDSVAPIDDRLLQTARTMVALAESADEQALSQEALHLADHEFDQAYASALRDAAAPAAPPTGPLKKLADRIAQLKATIAREQAPIPRLTKEAETDEEAASRLELVKAQLALDEDELDEAKQDLVRQGGDRHARLEQMLQLHEAAAHGAAPPRAGTPPATATLWEQVLAWLSSSERLRKLEAARQQVAIKSASLGREHDALEKLIRKNPSPSRAVSSPEASGDDEDPDEMLARLRHLSNQSKTLGELDKRLLDTQQLADAYHRWSSLVDVRRRSLLHLVLTSLAGILAILLAVVAIDRAIRYAFHRRGDHRRTHQLWVIVTIAIQLAGGLLIGFIIFGPPSQPSTIIGLTTAGLTVVLKDFIVGFFGWFALMGKNGIHIGDWVEIEGVGGEVIEIGLLKTVLLEMGDWTNSGHPTGRRVAFVNKFAIENHYFNFSTAGQWLWDELQMTLADTSAAYQMATRIRDLVERETETDARLAEQEWERATKQYGTRPFSARPAVDLRPTVNGLEIHVRYITRAPERYDVKSKLLGQIVGLVHPAEVTDGHPQPRVSSAAAGKSTS